jgi:muramoyltetrapeptide carboxypeptidase
MIFLNNFKDVVLMLGKRLCSGGTIGLISPASPENIDSIKKGILFFKNKGFNIVEGSHLYDKWGYLAGSDKDRASDLMDMFEDDSVDIILSVRGGYGSARILPYLDFDKIKNHPKIFAGFSDLTIILNLLSQKFGLTTFHSPMGSSNFEDFDTFNSFITTLMEGYVPYTINNPNGFPTSCIVKGEAEGHLVGGNLAIICSTLGTPYEIETKDKILFIEEVSEDPYRVDRMLTQLLHSYKLQQCKGIILGQFKGCSLPHYERSLTLEEVLSDRLSELNIPIFSGLSAGHDYPRLTLPMGAKVKINAETGIINVLEAVIY